MVISLNLNIEHMSMVWYGMLFFHPYGQVTFLHALPHRSGLRFKSVFALSYLIKEKF